MMRVFTRQIIRNQIISTRKSEDELERYFTAKFAEMDVNPKKIDYVNINERIQKYESYYAKALRTEASEAISNYHSNEV
ncbi:hypothetical protein GF319_08130 [Candidatus Bathyarchaeota archaeon]|jgi:hypothetical protein|nr:hypothetical protein [Candidatus Bathyarchaeota archaeon]